MNVRSPNVYHAMMNAKERLRHSSSWFPIPALLPFFLVLLLTAHVSMSTNPRTGHPAAVLPLVAEETEDSAIWFSMIIDSKTDEVVVADNYRQVFRWPQTVTSVESLKPFIDHLKNRAATEVKAAALSKKVASSQIRTIIAVDQTINYGHFRPILYALAEAGISNYGFETIHRQPLQIVEKTGSEAEHPEHL